jgi:hypothetical protein
MSLEGYTPILPASFIVNRGPNKIDPTTNSSYGTPVVFNVEIPTGSADRTYMQGSTSIQVIDPNGEGTCKPRLVAVASFSFKILNDLNAVPGSPFTESAGTIGDVAALLDFFKNIGYVLPSAKPLDEEPTP